MTSLNIFTPIYQCIYSLYRICSIPAVSMLSLCGRYALFVRWRCSIWGGIFTLTINLIVTGLFFPFIKPEVATGLFPLCFNGSFLNCLYESNPLLFVFILIFIYSIFSGYYSIISFLLSYTFNTTLFKVLIVFLMNLCISFFLTNIGLFDFDISNFLLSPSYRYIIL